MKGLYGLVLAGGQSSRMGRNKSLLDFHGMPQKDYAYQLLAQYCEKVFTSISADATLSEFKNPIPDKFAFGGPLNGILSALKHQQEVAWLSLPVDMPLVDKSIVQILIKNRDPSKIATCFKYENAGKLEPLLAIWEPHSRKSLSNFSQTGQFSPQVFLNSSDVNLVNIRNSNLLTSINTPEDLNSFLEKKSKS